MPTTFTQGGSTITPTAVPGFDAPQPAGTLVHPILGKANPDISFRPAMLRSGTMNPVFASETAANTARTLLAAGTASWQLTSTERATLNMKFVALDVGRVIGDAGEWTVSVGFQEIL